jgi:hypothetical protein
MTEAETKRNPSICKSPNVYQEQDQIHRNYLQGKINLMNIVCEIAMSDQKAQNNNI